MPTARLVMTVATLMVVLGCSSGGEAAGSCAGVVTYEDRDYLPTPGDDEVAVAEGTTGAYLVEGRDPAEAIAVGDTPSGARLMEIR
ncbi:hypothetical protein M2163_006135 [Streptomyces sp. SAI-135]|uniref:hypothetical protein n=1 Tax=unclassified Streptomyces TaxID=2593676 RepID=UPI002474765B|nr:MULTISPECIES: hypothetical protein [unclassified Streptomyces]MDH6516885.1 hypothetical protein [Streptomyces sp. SAI-090]MDH6549100.1 hypothetical protein [Streptomyces sp. SAI-041]MDH6619027.1 hypothetical protein [Streptomyces sp. SAI-135]